MSSHIWYDVIPAHELRIRHKVYVNRGYDPSTPTTSTPRRPTCRAFRTSSVSDRDRLNPETGVKLRSYWLDTAKPAGDFRHRDVPRRADVVVVGAG